MKHTKKERKTYLETERKKNTLFARGSAWSCKPEGGGIRGDVKQKKGHGEKAGLNR